MSGAQVHPTALVAAGAELGDDVTIGAYTVIGPRVRIGVGTRVGPHVVIEGRTTLGARNEVFQFASIGAVPQDLKYHGEDERADHRRREPHPRVLHPAAGNRGRRHGDPGRSPATC